ncbi:CST complex subunit CTC1 [Thunnus albacares]|uniref:CST complex subunit CTC1 n=1 Tax=Thunnus albacares TaxID=8236 RepID=UPI001CF6F69D|nr:CST complex subunit CTC1 [Thunnus albacares]XP_044197450.1 CST complex subunit CTC1 [Thunnus albacares]
MEPLQLLLQQFKPGSEAESIWLKDIFIFIREQVCPELSGPAPSGSAPPAADTSLTDVSGGGVASQLSVCVVKKIQEHLSVTHSLPVSYRPVCVSELLSRQHLACVSNLSWSTNQQRAWAKEAELSLSGHRALPRVNLLLIGCLREGRGGEWRLTDASGSVRCESLSPSPLWLNQPVFLPHWNYIPHNAPGQEEAGGCVELIGSPVLLFPGPGQGLAAGPGEGAGLSGVVGVREAAALLHNRARGRRLSVYGQVGSVCPLLVVAGTTFFCFTLTDESQTLPVLVKDSSRLWWSRCVRVGQRVCVTALRVCVLRGWRGNNILCVSDRSEIHAHTQERTHTPADTPPPVMMSHTDEKEEAEPERDTVQSAVRMKESRVISYQGTVTEVVSEGAGLYVIDRTVGLCLAYQPMLSRKLRAGDAVELHHVHFLYRPCPDFPPSMLCTCLRSTLRVTAFSRVGGSPPDSSCPGDGALPRLLLEKNMGVSEYLWSCHLSSQLTHSLLPSVVKQQCVCVLSWKLMERVWRRGRQGRRDIYSEMLDEPHNCPLTQYSADPAVHQYISVSELTESLQSECWSSVSLRSLLPPGGSSLTSSQINSVLAWSCRTLNSDPQHGEALRRRPLLLVGVLELPSQTSEHTLQLRDSTAAVACVVTETSEEEEGGQRAAFNTAWIGCLVCVQHFTMVTERFLQSDFPSFQHLDQDKFITHKHCRVYLQFSLDHVHILSPSVAMVTHLRQRGAESGGDVTGRKQREEEEEEMEGGQTAGRKRRREEEEEPDSSHSTSSVTMTTASRPCVSMVIRVQQKEGVAWRNTGVELKEEEAGLMPCFSVRASVIGPVVSWGRDPKNGPMTDRETETEKDDKVILVMSGASARWFPLLHPGCFYRLVAANTQDPSVLIGCGVSGRSGVELHTDSTLQVNSDWRFHTLTRPLLLHTYRQPLSPTVQSVSEVLDCSSADLVCFQGLVSERISLTDRTSNSGHTHTGVRLAVCDQSGRSLQVYLDLSYTPYPPGLLPGNTLLLSAFQRRLSRSGSVYCRFLPVSSVTVITLGDTSYARPPPAPMMHLGLWALSREHRCTVGQVKGHLVCFLFLQLQWSCSLCGSVYTQSCCSSQCRSNSAVFQSKAKLVIDDGTGEAHVWFSGALVRPLLGLADSQWEGLQRALKVRGHIRVYPRGRSLVCDSDSDDSLLLYLLCVCSSDTVCRSLSLTCRKHTNQRPEETRRFSRGDRDFMTRMSRPLQLTCLHINTD